MNGYDILVLFPLKEGTIEGVFSNGILRSQEFFGHCLSRRVVLIGTTLPMTSCQWREMFVCITSMQLSNLNEGFSYLGSSPYYLKLKKIFIF